MAEGGTREGRGSKESWVLGLLLGFKGGTFFVPISPESDFFMAAGNKKKKAISKEHIIFSVKYAPENTFPTILFL